MPAKPGDEIDTEERNVREIQLNIYEIDQSKHPITKYESGRVRYTATGTLYHGINAGHLRRIVMAVSGLNPAPAKAKRH